MTIPLRDALIEGLILDENASDNTIIQTILTLAQERNRYHDLASRSWTIVHKRARVVLARRDSVASESGRVWPVVSVATNAFETTIEMRALDGELIEKTVARDAAVPVLMPIPTRDGLVLLRGELGAQLVPLQDDAADDGDPVAADPDRHGQVHTGACGAHPHVSLPGCTPG